jgi:hypothetical protein
MSGEVAWSAAAQSNGTIQNFRVPMSARLADMFDHVTNKHVHIYKKARQFTGGEDEHWG